MRDKHIDLIPDRGDCMKNKNIYIIHDCGDFVFGREGVPVSVSNLIFHTVK